MKYLIYFILFFQVMASAQQRVLLVGGGYRPPEALKAWLQSTTKPKIMIITWASASKKQDYEDSLKNDFRAIGINDFLTSQVITPENKNIFLADLKKATHIFFSGGNQQLIMDTLKDFEVMNSLHAAYWKDQKPVAGTSAGTAVQGEMMIMGDSAPLQKGLAFLPKIITDQHFFLRHREERLRKYMNEAPDDFTGYGVDEDGSILFQRDAKTGIFSGRVIGTKNVMWISPKVNSIRKELILTTDLKPQ